MRVGKCGHLVQLSSLSDIAATCNVSCCCDTWEGIPSVFDMLGDISRKGGLGTVNSLSENQQPHRWIPGIFEFITVVDDATLE